jgi:hypothetical protein
VTPCNLADGHQYYGGNFSLPAQTRRDFSVLNTQKAVSSETLIKIYEATQCHNPESISPTIIVEKI